MLSDKVLGKNNTQVIGLKFDGELLLERVKIAKSEWTKMKGLLGKSKRSPLLGGEGLLLMDCNSIHGFFMRITIDVIFMDKNFKIIRLVPYCRPWHYALICLKAKHALETKDGFIEEHALKIGDQISFA